MMSRLRAFSSPTGIFFPFIFKVEGTYSNHSKPNTAINCPKLSNLSWTVKGSAGSSETLAKRKGKKTTLKRQPERKTRRSYCLLPDGLNKLFLLQHWITVETFAVT